MTNITPDKVSKPMSLSKTTEALIILFDLFKTSLV